MLRATLALTLAALVLGAPLASADFHAHRATGTFTAGNSASTVLKDACTMPGQATNNLDSSCRSLPAGLSFLLYDLSATSTAGSPAVQICFYRAGGILLSCNPAFVPADAVMYSISSASPVGVNVQWTLTVF